MLPTLIIALALAGQTQPEACRLVWNGTAWVQQCPLKANPQPIPPPFHASTPIHAWQDAVINGQTVRVWGYRDAANMIHYTYEANPHVPRPSTPTPPATPRADNGSRPADMPGVLYSDNGTSLNAGVDIEGLKHEAGRLYTNDRQFGAWFESSPKAHGSLALFGDSPDEQGSNPSPCVVDAMKRRPPSDEEALGRASMLLAERRTPKLPDLPPVRPTLVSDEAAKFAVLAVLGAVAASLAFVAYQRQHQTRPNP